VSCMPNTRFGMNHATSTLAIKTSSGGHVHGMTSPLRAPLLAQIAPDGEGQWEGERCTVGSKGTAQSIRVANGYRGRR